MFFVRIGKLMKGVDSIGFGRSGLWPDPSLRRSSHPSQVGDL